MRVRQVSFASRAYFQNAGSSWINSSTQYQPNHNFSTESHNLYGSKNHRTVSSVISRYNTPQLLYRPQIPSIYNQSILHSSIRPYSTSDESRKELANTSVLTKSWNWVKTLPPRFMEECRHYWTGTKLLGYEMMICLSLLRKITKGHTLSRRERRQLMRTAGDLLRLLPFAFFLVVPFMEFLLPFFLKLFPNMLPSTFHSSVKKEESRKKELKAKIEVAKFLQEILYNHAKDLTVSKTENQAGEFKTFMEQVRDGVEVENTSILRFASLFEDEFTLDQLTREQLLAMSKYMQLPAFGTDTFLRYNLNKKVQQLKSDDKMIESEGIETLTLAELQQACAARGLKAASRSKEFLRARLREWIDLSLKQNLPVSLLILANAFKITGSTNAKDALRDAIYHLPNSVVDSIRLKVASNQADANSLKLLLLKQESQEIKREKEEEIVTDSQIKERELIEWIGKEQDIAQSSVSFSAAQLKAMTEAVAALAESSSTDSERRQLHDLKVILERRKKEIIEAEAEEKEAQELATEDEGRKAEEKKKREELEKEKASLAKISDRLSNWVEDLEEATQVTSENIHQVLGLSWDQDKDGHIDLAELQAAAKLYKEQLPDELVHHVIERLDADNDGKIKIEELQQLADKYISNERPIEVVPGELLDKTKGSTESKTTTS